MTSSFQAEHPLLIQSSSVSSTRLAVYINDSQIDRKLVNELKNKDFDLIQADQDHCSAAIRYIISGVFYQYFATAMHRQKNDRNILIHRKWPSPLPDIKCRPDIANVLPLLTLATNKATISGTIDIVQELAERLELTDEVVRNKFILLKEDLMTICNCQRAIFWRQAKLPPLNKYFWLEPVAGLFHLQMNFLSLLFEKFWEIAGDLVSFNWYYGILKRKNLTKKADNKNFHDSDDFFCTIIEAMVLILCIHTAGCLTIDELQL